VNVNTEQRTMNRRSQGWFSTWDRQYVRRLFAIAFRAFSLSVLLAGIGFAAYAGVQWLQTAHWQPLTINGVLASSPTTRDWAAHPRAWLGLHRVIMWVRNVPVYLIVTLVGAILLVVSSPPAGPPRSSRWDETW
jgi:hypothetical protein